MNAKEYNEGSRAGDNRSELPLYQRSCPYDGRTREGRAWWKGYLAGEAMRSTKDLVRRLA